MQRTSSTQKNGSTNYDTLNGVPKPLDVYAKYEFKRIAFARCSSASHRDLFISSVRKSTFTLALKPWRKTDLPLDKLTAESALFAFKRMLVQWNDNKQSVQIDTDTNTPKVAGKDILKAKAVDFTLEQQWCDGAWEKCEDFICTGEAR